MLLPSLVELLHDNQMPEGCSIARAGSVQICLATWGVALLLLLRVWHFCPWRPQVQLF